MQKHADGIVSYKKVIDLDPTDPEVWLTLANTHAGVKNYQEGFATLQEGMRYHENHPDFYYNMAYFLLLRGRSVEAHEYLFKAMDIDPEGYKRLFESFPEAQKHPAVLDMITSYRK